MKLSNMVKELLTGFLQRLSNPWWVEITTSMPRCIYYFGTFQTFSEAKASYPGYIEDLDGEGSQGIVVAIKRCKPDVLTICAQEDS